MPGWLLWVVIAAACGAVEALTLSLVLGFAAGGAVAAAVTAAVGGGNMAQLIAFLGATAVLLAVVRPVAARHLQQPVAPELRSGIDALVGAAAVALTRVDGRGGQVRLRGSVWSARLVHADAVEAGAPLVVLQIDGATAVVYPTEV